LKKTTASLHWVARSLFGRVQPARAAVFCLCFLFVAGAAAQEAKTAASPANIVTFEIPGAGTGALQGTVGLGMNSAGAITGLYTDSNNLNHGYVRAADGTVTTFDVPEAGTGPGQGTWPQDINDSGVVAGLYFDSQNLTHGFVRDANGGIATFHCALPRTLLLAVAQL
jgi:hypothetical protein